MHGVDLLVLVVYLAGVTAFGCSFFFRKDAKGTEGFVTGGGKVPSWAIGLSLFATLGSSGTFIFFAAMCLPYLFVMSATI